MSKRLLILPATRCENAGYLESALAVLQVHGYISAGQNKALQASLKQHLPATLTIEQRDKKGATYALIGDFEYKVNNRGKIYLPLCK